MGLTMHLSGHDEKLLSNNCNNYTNFRIICQPGEEKNLYG